MIIFACILFLVALAMYVVGKFYNKGRDERYQTAAFGYVSLGIAGFAALFLLLSGFTSVSAGHIGVPVVYGSVQDYFIPEGLHPVNPFASVQEMSARSQDYTMVSSDKEGAKEGDDSIFAQSSNGVVLKMNLTVVYKLVEADAPWVYKHLGPKYVESIIRPAARSAVPETTSKFTFEEAYSSKREAMAVGVRDRMNVTIGEVMRQYPGFSGKAVIVQQVFIREVHPSKDLLTSIENKMAKDQEQQAMDFVLAKETKEAQRKKIEAGGIKDFQQIVTQGITPSLLEWKGIEATEKLAHSPNTKIIVVGNGKGNLPVILSSGQ